MATSPGEEADEQSRPSSSSQIGDDAANEHSSSYVSPASSASHTRANDEQVPAPVETRKTIDFPRGSSPESDMLQLTPEHQFGSHPSNLYDSDASEGSIVFSFNRSKPTAGGAEQANNHDRLPSFDSMASNGSFRLTGSQTSPRGAASHKMPPSPPSHTPVQFLPYDQRRKVMEKRQKMLLQQQNQQNLFLPAFQSPQVPQQQSPSQPFQSPHPHQMPYSPFPYADPQMPYPPQTLPVPYMMGGPTPVGPGGGGPMQSPSQTSTSRQPAGKPPKESAKVKSSGPADPKRKPPYHSLPPSGPTRPLSGSASGAPRSRTTSTDSAGSVEKESSAPPRPQRSSRAPLDTPPPPPVLPPPPPAQQVFQHIRGASSGSISSLGSAPDKPGQDFGPQPSLEEYHFQNQELLHRAEYERMRTLQAAVRPPSSPRSSETPSGQRDSWGDVHPNQMQRFHPSMNPAYFDWRQHPAGMVGPGPLPPDPYQHMYGNGPYYPVYPGPYGSRPPHGGFPMHGPPSQQYIDRRESTERSGFTRDDAGSGSNFSGSGDSADDSSGMVADERTSLLPPPGISTHEHRDRERESHVDSGRRSRRGRSSRKKRADPVDDPQWHDSFRSSRDGDSLRLVARGEEPTRRFDNRSQFLSEESNSTRRKKGRRKQRKGGSRSRQHRSGADDSDVELAISSSSESQRASRRKAKKLEKEKAKLIAKWKAEAIAEAEEAQATADDNRWHRRVTRSVVSEMTPFYYGFVKILGLLERFLSNLPLTIGAVALSIVTLGVVWFKFAEENLASCEPVHFHSSQCTFPEFPGCFYCNEHNSLYKVALNFHFICSTVAGILALSFIAKVSLAPRVVLDEMSSPTTASPAGLLCMTTVCVFAGRGWVGQCLVSAAASLHLCLAIWFLYICLAYHILPEPSWFPNTVGIGLSAVKTWLYYPMLGHLLMAVSLSLNCFFFPISLLRVTLNKKMSATVCWIQMSAPAISLYALTIMAQPSFEEEHPDVTDFQRVHRMVYLPCMHFFFFLACVGVASSIQSLWVRWDDFRTKAFSPAHAAFCFPTLAHANAIQAYRAAINTFADLSVHSPFKVALYAYWVTILVSGTLVTLYITAKFMYHLPGWTQIDVADEEEPPAPYDTILTQKAMITTGETLSQPFVSPAVLQANETGALVMISRGTRDGRRRYRRTRQLTALGFEPVMNILEMDREREVLLDWVGKHPPRRRAQTLSVPGIDFNYGFGEFGIGNSGVYGEASHIRSSTISGSDDSRRPRSQTADVPSVQRQRQYH